jgi:hypothetical protein
MLQGTQSIILGRELAHSHGVTQVISYMYLVEAHPKEITMISGVLIEISVSGRFWVGQSIQMIPVHTAPLVIPILLAGRAADHLVPHGLIAKEIYG